MSHENKKTLSQFYHKNIFDRKRILHSFSLKNIFYDKMDLRPFYFCVTICRIQIYKTKFGIKGSFLLTEYSLTFEKEATAKLLKKKESPYEDLHKIGLEEFTLKRAGNFEGHIGLQKYRAMLID